MTSAARDDGSWTATTDSAKRLESRFEQNSRLYAYPSNRHVVFETSGESPLTEPVTVFHTKAVPDVTLAAMARLVVKRAHVPQQAVPVAFALMLRYEEQTRQPITAHMMHRLFVASVQVAMKAHSDFFISNADMADVVGITRTEMNRLERNLVLALDWRVVVDADEASAVLSDGCRPRSADSTASTLIGGISPLPSMCSVSASSFASSAASSRSENFTHDACSPPNTPIPTL